MVIQSMSAFADADDRRTGLLTDIRPQPRAAARNQFAQATADHRASGQGELPEPARADRRAAEGLSVFATFDMCYLGSGAARGGGPPRPIRLFSSVCVVSHGGDSLRGSVRAERVMA
jgi:hypothetical protein